MNNKGKALIGIGVVAFIAIIMLFMMVERIPQGYVGVVYSMNGGVEDNVLPQGWHVISPTKKVTKYSIATEQLLMTLSELEGSDSDESFQAICKDGSMNIDIEMAYSFKPEDVSGVFTRYRGMSGEDVVNTIIKSKIRTYVSEVTSKYTIMEAYMEKKGEVNADLQKTLGIRLKDFGITVESVSITRAKLDASIETAIIERSKVAQELEAEIQKQKKATLQAQTKVITATGTADAAIEEARGLAESNKLISQSITQSLIDMKNAEARMEHGWVTIQGATPIVTNK